jgi:hypothetical protein
MVVKKFILFTFLFFCYFTCLAQNSFYDDIHLMDYQRTKQLLNDSNGIITNSFFIRSTSSFQFLQSKLKGTTKDIVQSINFSFDQQNNSLQPISFNDGNMYPARGWQERYSYGVNLKLLIFDINYQPEKLIVQNKTQEYYAGEPGEFMFKYFGMVANNIDNFRQFGYDRIEETTLGQSRVGIKTKYIAAGISNENIWWGPGKRNSLVFTNNAAGFKHYYLKTVEPIKTYIGSFELAGVVGKLDTTKYTDIDQDLLNVCQACKVFKNLDEREIDGITINYQPKWIPNFYIGYAYSRQFYRHATNALGDTVNFFSKDLPKQEIGSMFFRFTLPDDHAEFYGEMGMPNESPWPWKFFKERMRPGFVFGATKLVPLKLFDSYFSLNVEFTQLQLMNPRDIFYEGYPFAGGKPSSWYLSTIVKQGWSNNGQLMGSSIGPGSNNQSISLSWNKGYNKIGFFVERTVFNNDFYHSVYYNPYASNGYGYYNRYWVDLTKRLELQFMPIKNILLSASFTNTDALNYRWIRIEDGSAYDVPSKYSDKYNQQFQMSIKYLLHAFVK